MIYTPLTKKALLLMYEVHRDQRDKSGLPYVFHPFHLAEQMTDEACTVVALLHDVVEDSAYTLEDVAALGFGPEICAALRLLTHDPAQPYLEYVRRLATDPLARTVKIADLRHNSDLSRLEQIDEHALARRERYQAALDILLEADSQQNK